MKKIISLIILSLSLSFCSKPTKPIEKDYYFISYNISTKDNVAIGNFYTDKLLTNSQLVDSLTVIYKDSIDFKRKNVIITGIYKFKDSVEFNKFRK